MQHNSLGLRDIEHNAERRPNIMFVGDSFVWGYDVEARDRFTERLREQLSSARIINAGVPGYGTDQEYLLLNRIWNVTRPDVVVLIFCSNNDRADNSSNLRYAGYLKPYFDEAPMAPGAWPDNRSLGRVTSISRKTLWCETCGWRGP